jgi:putative DNA primase/helicase
MAQRQGKITQERIDAVQQRVALSAYASRYVRLARRGREHVGQCPLHQERTASFTIFAKGGPERFHCFGCGAHGDVIGFAMIYHGLEFPAAIEELEKWSGTSAEVIPHPRALPALAPDEPEWQPVQPVPDDVPPLLEGGRAKVWNAKQSKWSTLRPAHVAVYRDGAGALLGYVLRCVFDDGRKWTPQVTWCATAAGERRWVLGPFAEPRPLYGLDRLAARPAAYVLVVMGEKKCDELQALLPELAVLCWPGGDQGRGHVDFSPLAGRKVMIWPDLDPSGFAAAEGDWKEDRFRPGLAQLLGAPCPAGVAPIDQVAPAQGIRIVVPPADRAKGWDAGDAIAEGWTADQVRAFLRASLREPAAPPRPAPEPQLEERPAPPQVRVAAPVEPPSPPPPTEPPPDYGTDGPDDRGPGEPDGPEDDRWLGYFRPIGYDHGRFYFAERRGGHILGFGGTALEKKGTLFQLAPQQFWEREYPGKQGANFAAAANALIQACYAVGPYDARVVRGRGAWIDDERVVVHLGDRLLVDGVEHPVLKFRSDYVYERAPRLRAPAAEPLRTVDSTRFLDCCSEFTWQKSLSAYLLAGFCTIAPICGALEWRPSIWLLGPTGAGKGWILNNVVKPMTKSWAFLVKGRTTGSGIAQALGSDARPVIFDEFEGESPREIDRIREVLFLMRVGSSSDDGVEAKGTTDGRGRATQSVTCFAFASTNFPVDAAADGNRITPLRLSPNSDTARFAQIKRAVRLVVSPEFAAGLLARTISLVPVIRANADIFAEAATELWGVRRVGDQIGTLLAGAFSLRSAKETTIEAAKEWLAGKDWSDMTALDRESDERRCLNTILEYQVPMSSSNHGQWRETLGELVLRAAGLDKGDAEDWVPARRVVDMLGRHGLRVDTHVGVQGLYIATSNSMLQKAVLRDTTWSTNWKVQLERLPGAHYMGEHKIRFTAVTSRAVWIPLTSLQG